VGKTVAFTGRILPGAAPRPNDPPAGGEPPKYLNSPETPIFIKSRILFGLNKSKMEIAKSRTAVLMEGQMDLIVAWQAGVRNAVAVSGTGLSREHLERLRRIADTVLMSFDADDAGVKALDRAQDALSPYDFHLKAVDLAPYKDPGEACEKDPAFLTGAIARARPAYEQLIERRFVGAGGVPERKRAVYAILLKMKRLRSAAERDAWFKALVRESGISEMSLLDEFAALPDQEPAGGGASAAAEYTPPPPERIDRIAARLVTLSFTSPEFSAMVKSNQELLPESYRAILDKPDSALHGLAEMQASVAIGTDPRALAKELGDLIRELTIERLLARQAELRKRVKRAEDRGDEAEATAAKQEFHDVSQKLNELKTSR
ncbi:MAG: toprim domain-containing protein, partial [Patescibacteria group bacterium]